MEKNKRGSLIESPQKIISLENILNRPKIILIEKTTENFVKLIKEIRK